MGRMKRDPKAHADLPRASRQLVRESWSRFPGALSAESFGNDRGRRLRAKLAPVARAAITVGTARYEGGRAQESLARPGSCAYSNEIWIFGHECMGTLCPQAAGF